MVELSQAKFKEWKVWRVLMGFINVTRINNFAMKRNTSMVHVHCTYWTTFLIFLDISNKKSCFRKSYEIEAKIVFKCWTQVLDLMINSFFVKGHLFTKINSLPLNTWKSKSIMHVVIMLMTMMIMVMMLKWYSNY